MTNIRARLTGAALTFAALSFGAAPAFAQQCQLKEIVSLDMQDNAYGRILVPVTIDGTPRTMMIDTGAPLGILRADVADELGIKKQPMPSRIRFYSASGAKPTMFATVPSLKIGPEEAQYTDFLIANWEGAPSQFAGTLGYDILRNFDLDFDFAAKKLNLFSQDHCEGKVVYWAPQYTDASMKLGENGNHISVTMTLDGHDMDAILDTGASHTSLSLTEAKQSFGLDVNSPGVEKATEGTGADLIEVYSYRFKTLSLSGITVNNPMIYLHPDAAGQQSRRDLAAEKMQGYQGEEAVHTAHLILGTDVMEHLHLYIAYKENKIYATAADAHLPAATK